MSKSRFAAYTLAGCLSWNLILVYLGWRLGSLWGTIAETFRYINIAVYGLLILLIVGMVTKLTWRRSLRNKA